MNDFTPEQNENNKQQSRSTLRNDKGIVMIAVITKSWHTGPTHVILQACKFDSSSRLLQPPISKYPQQMKDGQSVVAFVKVDNY